MQFDLLKKLIKRCLILNIFLLLCLTGCKRQIDPADYVKSVLDALYHGDFSAYASYTGMTTTEASIGRDKWLTANALAFLDICGLNDPQDTQAMLEGIYEETEGGVPSAETGTDDETTGMISDENSDAETSDNRNSDAGNPEEVLLSEETMAHLTAFYKQLLSNAHYEVTKTEDGKVQVNATPVTFIRDNKEAMTAYAADFATKNDTYSFTYMDDLSYRDSYIQGMLSLLELNMTQMTYGEPATLTLELKVDDSGLYTFKPADIRKIQHILFVQ